ncbi:uncharacterized protein M421DRAFT_273163 [Didymella exigua CBS 183.55]|uniref:Uncharacterized protein n=1 Tax=Didymella exigua CBS 183.55 TaxID=1150837 RepID=A0A6A5R8U2_9PLEO|nr:uncharacterized protein M421DRAFT_273163 [Didymella exigua CBS 183.55]KAF1924645.1 hypothetical protein M421DRAFT_273163 [Didymella exigua CBS 183.55]
MARVLTSIAPPACRRCFYRFPHFVVLATYPTIAENCGPEFTTAVTPVVGIRVMPSFESREIVGSWRLSTIEMPKTKAAQQDIVLRLCLEGIAAPEAAITTINADRHLHLEPIDPDAEDFQQMKESCCDQLAHWKDFLSSPQRKIALDRAADQLEDIKYKLGKDESFKLDASAQGSWRLHVDPQLPLHAFYVQEVTGQYTNERLHAGGDTETVCR